MTECAEPLGLYVNVYKHEGRSHANGGISAAHDQVWVEVPSGWVTETDARDQGVPVVRVEDHPQFGPRAVPVDGPDDQAQRIGPMFRGTYLTTSDSRWSRTYGYQPIPLHDRWETAEQYQLLST